MIVDKKQQKSNLFLAILQTLFRMYLLNQIKSYLSLTLKLSKTQ